MIVKNVKEILYETYKILYVNNVCLENIEIQLIMQMYALQIVLIIIMEMKVFVNSVEYGICFLMFFGGVIKGRKLTKESVIQMILLLLVLILYKLRSCLDLYMANNSPKLLEHLPIGCEKE